MDIRMWITIGISAVLLAPGGCGMPDGSVAECGNGMVEDGEQCEPPNGITCSASCQVMGVSTSECGNGVVETGEECEPPGSASCSDACLTLSGPANTGACQTAPRAGDTDGDGISDADEAAGWTVFVDESGQGDTFPRTVTSDPLKADTDDDGLCDAEERASRTDPTRADTDIDGLSDFDELRVWGSSPTNVDTDGDATDRGTKPLNSVLFDGNEVTAFGTSPTLSDSDGDKISDFVEIIERGNEFNPLIANLPRMELSFEGTTDLRVDVAYSDSTAEAESHEVAMETERSATFSASTTATVKVWAEVGAKVGGETGFSVDSNKVTGEASATAGVSAEVSATLSAEAAQRSQETYQQAVEATRQEGRSLEGGAMGVGLVVRNMGDVSFDLSNLAITALRRDPGDPTRFSTVATLSAPLANSITLGPGDGSGLLRADVDLPANLALELMANPDSLVFETGNFDLLDDEGRNFAFFKEITNAQTGLITIEYGNGHTVQARVATNVRRENGQIAGVRISEALRTILGIEFDTAVNDRGVRILSSMRDRQLGQDIANVDGETIFWSVAVTSGIALTEETDFEDIVLRAGEGIYLLYVRDRDGDGLFGRDEFTYRTDDTRVDTDGDGLSDYAEVKDGWSVTDIGVPPYPAIVFSDPTRSDTDGDSLTDAEELDRGSDPRNGDTDGDGVLDSQDEAPLDPTVPLNTPPVIDAFEVTPSGLMVTLTATVSEVDVPGSIADVLVQWGDEQEEQITENFQNIVLTHDYDQPGVYTVTLTATDNRNALTTATQEVDVSSFPSEGLIAEFLMNADAVYFDNNSNVHYLPDDRADAPEREAGDPPGPTDGRLFRWQDAVWNGQGDGGTWIASDRFGQPNSAVYFSNANASANQQYGQVRVANLGFEQSFTLGAWVRENGSRGWIVGQENWANLTVLTNAGGIAFTIPGAGGVTLTDNTPLAEDTWHFVVATVFFDDAIGSSTVRLFRDGQVVATQTGVGSAMGFLSPSISDALMIGDGSADDDDSNALGAFVDDVRVWNRALSASEVQLLCGLGGYACGGE